MRARSVCSSVSAGKSGIAEREFLKAAEDLHTKLKFFTFTAKADNANILNFFGMDKTNLPGIRIVKNDLDNDGYRDLILDAGYNRTWILMNKKCGTLVSCGEYNQKFI